MENKVENGKIDEIALEIMQKEQIDLGLSDERQFRRTELNFYCEFIGELQKLNKNLGELYATINMVGQDKLMEYFKTLTENVKKEEARAKTEQKVKASHKKVVKKD